MALVYRRRTIFIFSSCIVAVLLIGTAYASSGPSIFSPKTVSAESTHDILVSYASKDSDNDGLPDWEEVLYGTDPHNPHSISPTLTDGEAVAQGLVTLKFKSATSTVMSSKDIPGVDATPSTITDQFSHKLIGQYLLTRGKTQPAPSDIATFVEQGVTGLKDSHSIPDAFNQGQVKVSGSGPDALLAYQATVEPIILKIDAGKPADEVQSFSDAVNKGDTKALVTVRKYADAYAVAARALMKVSVPSELAVSHLAFANNLMHVSESVSDLGAYDTDPIRTMLGLATYQTSTSAVIKAMKDMNAQITSENAVPATGAIGSQFYTLTKQAATLK